MNQFIKPLFALLFLFATSSLFPAFGLHLSPAATITLTLVGSSADVSVTIENMDDGTQATGTNTGYALASVTVNYDDNNWADGGRHSATYVNNTMNPSLAAIALYGSHSGSLENGFWASGGGMIVSQYEMTVASDYGAFGGPAATHIIIDKGELPDDGNISFTIWDSHGYNPILEWSGEEDPVDTWTTLTYGETYQIDAYFDFGFDVMVPGDFDMDYSQSLQIWVDESPVPIPGAVWLLGSGLFGLAAIRRKKKSS